MIHFLSGMPRSGSTLLGALLSQRSDTSVSATSGLIDIMGAVAVTYETSPMCQGGDAKIDGMYPILHAVAKARYPDDLATYIDKSRGWPEPKIMATMAKVLDRPLKIIATVRPIADCIASFMHVTKTTLSAKEFVKTSPLVAHVMSSYATLKEGFAAAPENFLIINFDDLLADPQAQCDRVADFLDLPRFQHTLTGLSNPVPENDEKTWGVPGLHDVRSEVVKNDYDAEKLLGSELYNIERGCEFWHTEPPPARLPGILDLQNEAFMAGEYEKAEAFCAFADPADDRAMFNKGWYLLRQGKMQEGFAHLDRGRADGLFGLPSPSQMPLWNGQRLHGETVLMHLEGGFGDQICNARFARDIAKRGGKVVLAGSPELAEVLSRIHGVDAYVEHRAAGGVYHQYWLPSSSAVRPLGLEYQQLDGSAFIPRPAIKKLKRGNRLRVGIRWAGLHAFVHENYRRLNPEDLFGLENVDLVSLQRDDPVVPPEHVETPLLTTWGHTAAEIANLDLVISSCTSTAHLAAAMGKPTWIVIPKNSEYFLWAIPGDRSAWYNSVRLFRQETCGDWSVPMAEVRQELERLPQVAKAA